MPSNTCLAEVWETIEDREPVLIEVDSRVYDVIRALSLLCATAIQMAAGSSVGLETDLLPTMVAQTPFASHGASMEAQS